ncbi:conserved Plasmodium protein, unknown function [Plasmodium ovale wallikeri]|uniref:Uncharacterized protein n=1 Tax=Plasmodium ovale wallikeri TaxID=864142 RepID=A0A1A8YI60_PLAOA|nr:conserved Plasmodium protein, unknown function [Plasmodium ovale wallikeri]
MFNGIIGNHMKNAKNVFDEVKEHIKCTAKEAKKNMNYPFCKAPCNIENLKNTIFINEEEIIINKKIYKNIFQNKKDEKKKKKNGCERAGDRAGERTGEKEDIFTCDENDISFRGNYNFGFHVEVTCENDENKIVAYAYDKETNKKIPCSYRWWRMHPNRLCNITERSINLKGRSCSGNGGSFGHMYESEYELTSEDIGLKICVECSCISNEQITAPTLSKICPNESEPTKREGKCRDRHVSRINDSHLSLCDDNNFYSDVPSFKCTFREDNGKSYMNDKHDCDSRISDEEKNSIISGDCNGESSSNSGRLPSLFHLSSNYRNTKKGGIPQMGIHTPYESSLFDKKCMISSPETTSVGIASTTVTTTLAEIGREGNLVSKYSGVAIAEIGPFNLSAKTKTMLENIIQNDTIRYPLYIIRKESKNEKKMMESKSNLVNTFDDMLLNGNSNNLSLSTYNEYRCVDTVSESSNSDSDNDSMYMLHIHRNEVKIIHQNSKTKHMWNYKFNSIYPYIEIWKKNKDYFLLHINDSDYYICKCLYKRHRDIITIILRYMHANLYIINEYIFNNINENLEGTRIKNIFHNVDVDSILENINKELIINRKINEQYEHKIRKLQGEKNLLEEDLKNTIEAFQAQLDNAKRFKDEKELLKTNEKLMKEVKILQEKYKNVDLFFKNKYKPLLGEIEKYKKLVQECKTKTNSKEEENLRTKLQSVEREKTELLNEKRKISNSYNEEKRNKLELENRLENLNLKLELLNKSLQEERVKGLNSSECLREMEDLKRNNITLQKENAKISNEVNLLITEKNRLTKLVDSLTKDIEKSKVNGSLRGTGIHIDSEHESEKLLKEVLSLRDENELLKKRIKKMAKFGTAE